MSELTNARNGRKNFRWQLLTTVSAVALIGNVYGMRDAKADGDSDRPSIWIELGGQLEQQTGQGDVFLPPFVADNPASLAYKPISLSHVEKPPIFSNGLDGKITFEPDGTDWVFSAAVRYGRSVGRKDFHQSHNITDVVQVTHFGHTGLGTTAHGSPVYGPIVNTKHFTVADFALAQIMQAQSHAILDFAVGKDVGLGMFGKGSTSVFDFGVRFALFSSKVSGTINARPDAKLLIHYDTYFQNYFRTRFPGVKWREAGQAHHTSNSTFESRRNFHGIGPSLSWNASLPMLGAPQSGILNIDWGANAALLFGRQLAGGAHHTSGFYHTATAPASIHPTHHTSGGSFNRSKTVIVPNVGGFAGLSFNFVNVKVALGYRGDFFFGAMDAGNDTRKTEIVGFYGPFASISVGFL